MIVDIEKAIISGKKFDEYHRYRMPQFHGDMRFNGNPRDFQITMLPDYSVVHPKLSSDHKKYREWYEWFWMGYSIPLVHEDKRVDSLFLKGVTNV